MANHYTRPEPQQKNQGLVVTFDPAVIIKTVGGIELIKKKVTIIKMTDSPVKKTVEVLTDDYITYTLWKDAAYDAIGQWTNDNVITRITELIKAGTTE